MQFGRVSVANRKEIQITETSTYRPAVKTMQPAEYRSRIKNSLYVSRGTEGYWNERDIGALRNKESHVVLVLRILTRVHYTE
jgi:hypothetical protein